MGAACGGGASVLTEFRWFFTDDIGGDDWSDWHKLEGKCDFCCCGGPFDGEHQQMAGYYDEYEYLDTGAHTRRHPVHDSDLKMEWR